MQIKKRATNPIPNNIVVIIGYFYANWKSPVGSLRKDSSLPGNYKVGYR